MIAIVKMYEHKLKELNPDIEHITYDINDLYNYIDSLHDICGLMYVYFVSSFFSPYYRIAVIQHPIYMNQKVEIGLKQKFSNNLNNKQPNLIYWLGLIV